MISRVIFLNFAHLDIDPSIKDTLTARIGDVVSSKFEATNSFVTSDMNQFAQLREAGIDFKQVIIHNQSELEGFVESDALGQAYPSGATAFVDLNKYSSLDDFPTDNLEGVSQQIGALATHEAGHLFLPSGHSIDGLNIMSSGNISTADIAQYNGMNLEFSDIQKAILREDLTIDPAHPLAFTEADLMGIDHSHIAQLLPDEYQLYEQTQEIAGHDSGSQSGDGEISDDGSLEADSSTDLGVDDLMEG